MEHKHEWKHIKHQDINSNDWRLEVWGCVCGAELHKKYFDSK